jgi:hypothetical protein
MPCSPIEGIQRFRETYRVHFQVLRESQEISLCLPVGAISLAYSSILKMDAVFSPETSVNLYRILRRHIQENSTLHSHRCQNLKSNICN